MIFDHLNAIRNHDASTHGVTKDRDWTQAISIFPSGKSTFFFKKNAQIVPITPRFKKSEVFLTPSHHKLSLVQTPKPSQQSPVQTPNPT
jgi:hypothetical protein